MYVCFYVRIRVHVCPSGVQMMTLVIIPWVSPTFSYTTEPPKGMFLTNEEFWMISECNMKGPAYWGFCPAQYPTSGKPKEKSHTRLHKTL